MMKKIFGITKSGSEVNVFTLKSSRTRFEILDFGCYVKNWIYTKPDGTEIDVVLGYDSLSGN